jgi:sulfoquinovose isomerase
MHLTEACMAAHEATGDGDWLEMAESIATLIVHKHAAALGGRLSEHFTETWEIDRGYAGDEVFRPPGYTPGHWLEWTRLLLQLWEAGGRRLDWVPNAAKLLFANAIAEGWDSERGGFVYTLDWDCNPSNRRRLFWPQAEGVGAAAFLGAIDGAPEYEIWYRRIWDFIADNLVDRAFGGWRSEAIDPAVSATPFFEGKPDLYHDLQACLIPLLPTTGSITRGLRMIRHDGTAP